MAPSQFAQSHGDFRAMARSPSYRAPRACDVLNPPPFVPPQAPRMWAEERRLLDGVIATPDDDTPRRAMAEWLIADGDEARGGYILDELAGFTPLTLREGPGEGSSKSRKQEPSVRGREGRETTADWERVFEPWSARDFVWRRGFVESLSLAGRAFISIGAPLFAMTPLRSVRLVAVQPYIAELAACPHLAKLESLDLRGNHIGDDGLRILASSIPHLVRLNLSTNSLTPRSDAILASLRMRGLDVVCGTSAFHRAA